MSEQWPILRDSQYSPLLSGDYRGVNLSDDDIARIIKDDSARMKGNPIVSRPQEEVRTWVLPKEKRGSAEAPTSVIPRSENTSSSVRAAVPLAADGRPGSGKRMLRKCAVICVLILILLIGFGGELPDPIGGFAREARQWIESIIGMLSDGNT